jgi:hypothetical protein
LVGVRSEEKFEMPKIFKIKEFCHILALKSRSNTRRLRCASDSKTLVRRFLGGLVRL